MTTRLGSLLLLSCLVALVGCADAASDDDCSGDARCKEEEPAETGEVLLRGAAPASFVTVTASPSPASGGNVSARASSFRARCSGMSCTLPPGTQVTLTALPAAGYRFERWAGCADSTSSTLVVVPRTSTTCTASFVKPQPEPRPQFTVAARGGSLGSVSASTQGVVCPGAVCRVDAGGTVSLSALPAPGATFLNWSGCAGLPSGLTLTLANVGADATCTASFAVALR